MVLRISRFILPYNYLEKIGFEGQIFTFSVIFLKVNRQFLQLDD